MDHNNYAEFNEYPNNKIRKWPKKNMIQKIVKFSDNIDIINKNENIINKTSDIIYQEITAPIMAEINAKSTKCTKKNKNYNYNISMSAIPEGTELFARTIYNNFLSLADYPVLKHTMDEIRRLLMSDDLILYLAIRDKKIIGYLVGEFMTLNDGRNVLYISYLYVASKFRKHNVGSNLLKMAMNKSIKSKLNGILLISDTEDKQAANFYAKHYFSYDNILRRYERYDVLSRMF